MKFAHAIFCSSVFFLGVTVANADDSFRCGSYIVEIGDNQETVREHCGQPATDRIKKARTRRASITNC